MTMAFFSCGQEFKSTAVIVPEDQEAPKTADIAESQNKNEFNK